MSILILAIILIPAAIAFCIWVIRSMLSSVCPDCLRERSSEEMVVPVIPAYRWYCPFCGGVFKSSEVKKNQNNE